MRSRKNLDVVGELGNAPRAVAQNSADNNIFWSWYLRAFLLFSFVSLSVLAGVSGCGLRAWRIAGAICAFMVLGDK
jgi:hypothetical protein